MSNTIIKNPSAKIILSTGTGKTFSPIISPMLPIPAPAPAPTFMQPAYVEPVSQTLTASANTKLPPPPFGTIKTAYAAPGVTATVAKEAKIADAMITEAVESAKDKPGIKILANAIDLSKRTVCAKLTRGKLGNTRKVGASEYEISADKDMIRVSKFLLDSVELKAIDSLDGEVSRWLERKCLPFQPGVHMVPYKALEQVDSYLKKKAAEREGLVQIFINAYPTLVDDASTKLKGQYDPAEYPPVHEVRKRFTFFWQYVSFGVPDELKDISAKVWAEEKSKAAQQMAEASANIQMVLRESMNELVKHMADRLAPDEEGKPKILRGNTVKKLTEFLGDFDFRNVTDDTELQAIVTKAKVLLAGVDTQALKDQDTLRSKVQAGMAGLAAQLETMVAPAGTRKFDLED